MPEGLVSRCPSSSARPRVVAGNPRRSRPRSRVVRRGRRTHDPESLAARAMCRRRGARAGRGRRGARGDAARPAVSVRRPAAGAGVDRDRRGRERAARRYAGRLPRAGLLPAPRRGRAHAAGRCAASRWSSPTRRRGPRGARRGLRVAHAAARRSSRRRCGWRCSRPPSSSAAAARAARRRIGRALAAFADLRAGDYVVHEDHGVGRFVRFDTKEVGGVVRDYLYLEFRGDDRLYVPHEQLGKVSRYIGADGRAPGALEARRQGVADAQDARPHRRARAGRRAARALRARARGHQAAVRRRRRVDGPARGRRSRSRRPTTSSAAIDAVTEDMEAERPMDRLVCGDVGFGKTEVALRAAFKAVASGRQVLMLVPTTILAQQHGATFRDRFRDLPVRVEMVSRFRPPAEVKRCSPTSATGKVDVLIGTHRVLSRDVVPAEPRAGDRRRGAALRRRPEGAPAPDAAGGRRAGDVGDADPAHAAHVAVGPARHLGDHHPAARPPPDQDPRRRVRRGADRRRAAPRVRPRGPVVLPAQPGRDDRRGGRAGAPVGARAARRRRPTARCPSASSRT